VIHLDRKEIEIEKIVTKDNPRTILDNEPLDELTASIREKGVLQPVLLRPLEKGRFELISGSRRLRAAKAAGLAVIPYDVALPADENEIAEMKLEENIHRVDLTPIEEGAAFREYLDKTKKDVAFLAKKISKPALYIERRLALVNLPKEHQDAINRGKMTMGHGLALARVKDQKKQKELFKQIVEDRIGVRETIQRISHHHIDLSDAIFDRKGCQGCPHNGGEQAILFETGTELKGICLNPSCFHRKTSEHIQEKTRKLQKQGIRVLSPAHLGTLKRKETISTWEDDYKEIVTKKLQKEPDNYAVAFIPGYDGIPEKTIVCTNPLARAKNKEQITAEDEVKERQRKAREKLKNKVDAYKQDFLIKTCAGKMAPAGKAVKVMALYGLLLSRIRNSREEMKELIKEAGLKFNTWGAISNLLPKLWGLDEGALDRHLAKAAGLLFCEIGMRELLHSAGELRVDMEKEFQIDEAFLKLHTKDQLTTLAKEIGLNRHMKEKGKEEWAKGKRQELIDAFLKEGFSLKGIVPKSMQLPASKKRDKPGAVVA